MINKGGIMSEDASATVRHVSESPQSCRAPNPSVAGLA